MKVFVNTKKYQDLFHAHKMESRVLYETCDRFDVTFSELVSEGVRVMNQIRAVEHGSDEHHRLFEEMIEIQNEQRRFARSLVNVCQAAGIEILSSIDCVDMPF